MNDDSSPQGAPAPGTQVFGSGEQRRQLLKAVVASGALGGAGVAGATVTRPHCKKTGSNHNYHPTASAVGSIIGSVVGTDPPKHGHTCAHYRNSGNWQGWSPCTNGSQRTLQYTLSYNNCANQYNATRLRFWQVFDQPQATSGNKSLECWDLLANYPNSDEAIFLTALFNACKLGTAFPYNADGVIDLYNERNPLVGRFSQAGLRAKARDLFRDYLSQTV